jgi:hypothetical protein
MLFSVADGIVNWKLEHPAAAGVQAPNPVIT